MLIASSGDAETAFVQEAVDAWAEESGNTVEVVVAQDMAQQLAQGFAGGEPPDVFYLDAGVFADYASNGSLEPYAEQITDVEDFYEPLRQTFTYDGTEYCVPKDFSTLALEIRTDAWEAAGLTDDDIPTTWDELADGRPDVDDWQTRSGSRSATPATASVRSWCRPAVGSPVRTARRSPPTRRRTSRRSNYVKGLLDAGTVKYPPALDAGWGGEAFGTGKAAMTIEGNWIKGAMTNDYPDVDYTVVELPEGPAGKGTLQFTQCWGIAAQSDAKAAAIDLVDYPDRARAAARRSRGVRRDAVTPVGEPGIPRAVPGRRGVRRRRGVRPGSGECRRNAERAGRLRRGAPGARDR